MIRYAINLSVRVIVLSAFVGIAIAAGYAQGHPSASRGLVVDQAGAAVEDAEVVFKGGLGAILTHTGRDGSVNVNLEAGNYVVTVSQSGVSTTKLVDVSIENEAANPFRVVLRVDQRPFGSGSDPCPCSFVPIYLSELPDIIRDEPSLASLPVVQPATANRRSMRCL